MTLTLVTTTTPGMKLLMMCAMGKSRNERVARKETTDEATDVSLEHWGRGPELNGDQVAGLEKHVEATEYDTEGEYDTDTDESDSYSLASLDTGECRPGQFICLGQTPSFINWHGYCELCKGHFRGCWDNRLPDCKGEKCQYPAHYERCWEESEPCRGAVCRYDPEGEYDTDTDSSDIGHQESCYGCRECDPDTEGECDTDTDTEYDTNTDESDSYSLASSDTGHQEGCCYYGCWECDPDTEGGCDADTDTELNGDQVAGLEQYVEAHKYDTDVSGSYSLASRDKGECQPGQFTCLGQKPSFIGWHGYCEFCKGHFRGCWDNRLPDCKGETCQYPAHYERCWEESEPCQGAVCRYDP